MQDAQRAQGLDQAQFPPVEFGHGFVAVEEGVELASAVGLVATEQHPEVLHGRCHAGVVKVHKVRALGGPEHVARVAVAMHTAIAQVGDAVKGGLREVERLVGGAEPARCLVRREDVV